MEVKLGFVHSAEDIRSRIEISRQNENVLLRYLSFWRIKMFSSDCHFSFITQRVCAIQDLDL